MPFDRDNPAYGTPTTTWRGTLVYLEEDQYGGVQVEGFSGQTLQTSDTVLAQHYGFSSYPVKGTELVLQRSGCGGVFSTAENCLRPTLKSGESKMWAKEGQYVYMTETGQVDIAAKASQPVVVKSPTLLGDETAAEVMLLGTTLLSEFGTFVGSWKTAVENLAATPCNPSDVVNYANALKTALGILAPLIAAWASAKHKLDA